MTLVEFLKARLDEDEQEAREAQLEDAGGANWGSGAVLISPARMLAEAKAKRRIIDECERKLSSFVGTGAQVATEYLTLRLLALPYADHPSYREEWHPA